MDDRTVETESYVVVCTLRDGRLHPTKRSELVEARSNAEAVSIALEGNSWETEDGYYDVRAAKVSGLDQFMARRQTDVTVLVQTVE